MRYAGVTYYAYGKLRGRENKNAIPLFCYTRMENIQKNKIGHIGS